MEHWFDNLTKGVAQSAAPRRTFLKGVLAAAVTCVVKAPSASEAAVPEAALAQANSMPGVPQATPTQANDTCTIRTENGLRVLQFSVQSTFTGQPLVLSGSLTIPRAGSSAVSPPALSRFGLSPVSPPVALTSESQTVTAITLGGTSLARMTSTTTLQ